MEKYPVDEITFIDGFCGAGGTTTGVKAADPRLIGKKAINHWKRAIATHGKNHPEMEHLCTDIDETDPKYVGHSTFAFWSPECKNHSLAKGAKRKKLRQLGLPFDGKEPELPPEAEERSRCTMWDPLRFAEENKNLFVVCENVPDVNHWSDYQKWCKEWDRLDYYIQPVYINSMFMGVPQSRDRWYCVAWKKGIPRPNLNFHPLAYCPKCDDVVAAVQSWKKKGAVPWGRYGRQGQYWYRCPKCTGIVTPYYPAAANIIDWSIQAEKIGERKEPLADKTMERIRYGLAKFRGQPFTTQLNKTSIRAYPLLEGVFPTQTGDNSQYIVHPHVPFLLNLSHAGIGHVTSLDQAMPTQTVRHELGMAIPPAFTMELNHGDARVRHMTRPIQTMTRYDDTAFVTLPFILDQIGEYRVRPLSGPMSTIVGEGNHHSLVTPPFFVELHGTSTAREATKPLGSVCAGGEHHGVVTPPGADLGWLVTYYNNGQVSPLTNASPTQTTHDSCGFLSSHSVPETEVDILECRFRMLEPKEIKAAMAFPTSYVITGNRKEQVKQLGNAVTPPVMTWIVLRCLESLR